jgi:hypothetical protein
MLFKQQSLCVRGEPQFIPKVSDRSDTRVPKIAEISSFILILRGTKWKRFESSDLVLTTNDPGSLAWCLIRQCRKWTTVLWLCMHFQPIGVVLIHLPDHIRDVCQSRCLHQLALHGECLFTVRFVLFCFAGSRVRTPTDSSCRPQHQ